MLKKIILKVKGIHCQSCKTLIETELKNIPGVKKINVDLIKEDLDLVYDEQQVKLSELLNRIEKLGYQASSQENDYACENQSPKNNFWLGILIPIGVIILIGVYLFIARLGGFELLSKLSEGHVSYGIIFIIGILAGFHCIGMCGGLVITYSANDLIKNNENKKKLKPHFQYNLGRLISYTLIGGLLGAIGTFFAINPHFTGIILLLAGLFMILMGLSFIFKWNILQKIKIRTPQFIARYLYNQKNTKKPKGPFIIGLLNGFMPCGPLQAMQLYALTTGSFFKGALSMGLYALGTIPLMFGFGAFLSMISNAQIKKFIKISGVLVAILGLIMINRGLTNFGYGFSFSKKIAEQQVATNYNNANNSGYQTVKMQLSYLGYEPNVLYIKKGIPVRWIIDVKQMSGCTNAILLEDFGIRKNLVLGENIIEFTPEKAGEIKFSCWMKMVWGKFIVTE